MSQFSTSGGQSIRSSALALVLPIFRTDSGLKYSGLISFRMDWLDVLAVQRTLKSLLQHHSSKASILWCSAFFIVQLSHPYMTIGKIRALTRQTIIHLCFSIFSFLSLFFDPLFHFLLFSFSSLLPFLLLFFHSPFFPSLFLLSQSKLNC